MLENPEYLPQMVARSGAHSTDLEAPESVEHLCNKCESSAACWRPEAETLWDEEHHFLTAFMLPSLTHNGTAPFCFRRPARFL